MGSEPVGLVVGYHPACAGARIRTACVDGIPVHRLGLSASRAAARRCPAVAGYYLATRLGCELPGPAARTGCSTTGLGPPTSCTASRVGREPLALAAEQAARRAGRPVRARPRCTIRAGAGVATGLPRPLPTGRPGHRADRRPSDRRSSSLGVPEARVAVTGTGPVLAPRRRRRSASGRRHGMDGPMSCSSSGSTSRTRASGSCSRPPRSCWRHVPDGDVRVRRARRSVAPSGRSPVSTRRILRLGTGRPAGEDRRARRLRRPVRAVDAGELRRGVHRGLVAGPAGDRR